MRRIENMPQNNLENVYEIIKYDFENMSDPKEFLAMLHFRLEVFQKITVQTTVTLLTNKL